MNPIRGSGLASPWLPFRDAFPCDRDASQSPNGDLNSALARTKGVLSPSELQGRAPLQTTRDSQGGQGDSIPGRAITHPRSLRSSMFPVAISGRTRNPRGQEWILSDSGLLRDRDSNPNEQTQILPSCH